MQILLETSNSFSNAFKGVNAYAKLNAIHCIYLNNKFGKLLTSIDLKGYLSNVNLYDWSMSMMPDLRTGMSNRNILWVHDTLYFEENLVFGNDENRFAKMQDYVRRRAENAEYIITPSLYSKLKIIRYLEIKDDKVKVFPLQLLPEQYLRIKIDKNILDYVRQKYGIDQCDKTLLFVGSPHFRKNLATVVQMFRQYRISNPSSQLIIVSYSREDIKSTFELYCTLNSEVGVKLVKHIPDNELIALYYTSTALINLSIEEGFGLPNVEAQFCGLPIISSNVSCMREILGDGAIYVDPYNIDEACEKILDLEELKNKQNIVELAKKNAEKYFDVSRYSELFNLMND